MREFIVNVQYVREGGTYEEPWYAQANTEDEAIESVKKCFHTVNDGVFPEAKDADFTLQKSYDLPGA